MGALKRKLSLEAALNTILGGLDYGMHYFSSFIIMQIQKFKYFSLAVFLVFLRATSRCLILEDDMHLNLI